ncbi:hypothetical protein SRO_3552 [Streptomyces rochei]|nr:hypothetical protein SRO_3552 [Streptomyces rochei]
MTLSGSGWASASGSYSMYSSLATDLTSSRGPAKSGMDRSTSDIWWASAYSCAFRLKPAVEKTA